MAAYNRLPDIVYNEFDEQAAAWLRELIRRGLIAPGEVDTRSIVDVCPDDLRGVTQFHAFAGIGVWSYAARRAGWPDDRPLWTGSPPCQPFSAAGKGLGTADERHLWPAYFHLLDVCRPNEFFGEQVASKDALAWLDHVSADVEGAGYAFGATDLCAAGFGAPHIRQRLFFAGTQRLADDDDERRERARRTRRRWARFADDGADGGLGHGLGAGLEGHAGHGDDTGRRSLAPGSVAAATDPGELGGLSLPDDAFWRANLSRGDFDDGSDPGRSEDTGDVGFGGSGGGLADQQGRRWREECPDVGGRAIGDSAQGISPGFVDGGGRERVADDDDDGLSARSIARFLDPEHHPESCRSAVGRPGPTNGQWGDADWLLCRDGKWRPVEPGTFPLAHGAAARVGRLRGYGNAIVAQVAEGFIRSYIEAEADGFRCERQYESGPVALPGGLIPTDLRDLLV